MFQPDSHELHGTTLLNNEKPTLLRNMRVISPISSRVQTRGWELHPIEAGKTRRRGTELIPWQRKQISLQLPLEIFLSFFDSPRWRGWTSFTLTAIRHTTVMAGAQHFLALALLPYVLVIAPNGHARVISAVQVAHGAYLPKITSTSRGNICVFSQIQWLSDHNSLRCSQCPSPSDHLSSST